VSSIAADPHDPAPAVVPRRGASEEVADAIRDLLLREGMRPGDRLGREEDLARRFGVSRPTLREALRLLSSSHLIRATKGPGGGIFVAATPEEGIGRSVTDAVARMLSTENIDLDELLETRMLLEVPLAGLAAQRASVEDIARLDALLAEAVDLQVLDRRLHELVAEIAGNRLAGAFMTWVVEVLQPSLFPLVAPALVDEVIVDHHRDIVRAIERGDPVAAERAMREHLVYLHDLVTAVRRSEQKI